MSTKQVAVSAQTHMLRALSRWPADPIRPSVQFQDVLRRRLEEKEKAPPSASGSPSSSAAASASASSRSRSLSGPGTEKESEEELSQARQANALYSLLEDRYKTEYPIKGSLLSPRSNPTYFADLVTELQEAPHRSWFERIKLRVKGAVRLK